MNVDDLTSTDDARIWGHRILQRLEDAEQGESDQLPAFPEPDVPFWALGISQELVRDWDRTSGIENPFFVAALELLLQRTSQWLRQSVAVPVEDDDGALRRLLTVQSAAELYLKIRHGKFARVEGSLLQVPFASGHSTAIRMGVDLLLQQPPDAWTSASLALSPLLQYDDWEIDEVFPRILESSNPSILASALDIANHLYLRGNGVRGNGGRGPGVPPGVAALPGGTPGPRTDQAHPENAFSHPAAVRYPVLVPLLGEIVQRLGVLEENPAKFGDNAETIQRILFDSVSLCVSLCHTMSCIGKEDCVGKLNQALELKHRRIRAEAAFALAKLGEAQGEAALVELASDPAVRTRVLAYAEELGCSEKIDEKYRTVLAIAESQLAQWLAQVEQMGLPPTRMELIEQRTLPWPGFEAPQECFLFRFGYGMQESEFSNVGFAGPVPKAFSQDLANLSTDDAFAIFAGWDIEHPDIYETPANRLATGDETTIAHWIEQLQLDRFEKVEPIFVANFFEQLVLVGYGERSGRSQPIAFDGKELVAIPSLAPNHDSLALTYYLWRGREFFRTFHG